MIPLSSLIWIFILFVIPGMIWVKVFLKTNLDMSIDLWEFFLFSFGLGISIFSLIFFILTLVFHHVYSFVTVFLVFFLILVIPSTFLFYKNIKNKKQTLGRKSILELLREKIKMLREIIKIPSVVGYISKKMTLKETLLLGAVFLIFFLNLYFASNAYIVDSDSGFEYLNAEHLIFYGLLEPGPVIQQIIYAILFTVIGLDFRVVLAMQVVLSTLVILSTLRIMMKLSGNEKIYVPLLTVLFVLGWSVYFWACYSLKQYPLFLYLIMLSLYSLYKYLYVAPYKQYLFLSAFFIGIGMMTHLLTYPFALLFILFFLTEKIQSTVTHKKSNKLLSFNNLMFYYVILFLTIVIYIFWRGFTTGFTITSLTTYPASWGTIKYGRLTNIVFWKASTPFTVEYVVDVLRLLNTVIHPEFLILSFLGFFSVSRKKFFIFWAFALFFPYIIGRGVISWVYLYPFIPFFLLLGIEGIKKIEDILFTGITKLIKENRRRAYIRKLFTILVILLLFTLNISYFYTGYSLYKLRQSKYQKISNEIQQMGLLIPKGAKILFRCRSLAPNLPERDILLITKDLTENDAINYLNWTSDEIVREIFLKYNISYVVLYVDIKWERNYHYWFFYLTGKYPKHYILINESPYFIKLFEGKYYKLYKFIP